MAPGGKVRAGQCGEPRPAHGRVPLHGRLDVPRRKRRQPPDGPRGRDSRPAARRDAARGAGRPALVALRHAVFVSCNPSTLARDLSAAAKAGFTIRRARLFDMFPRTMHFETAVLLERQ
ncbi:MAG: hypothetical protein IKH04_03985 [Kiritimatiellae bacterium]|nr:hypothetical protein [Kiritimatiellia bacterium]